jgi:hypothetical protein
MEDQAVTKEGPKEKGVVQDTPSKPTILKKFPTSGTKVGGNLPLILGSILVVLLGVGTGWFLSGSRSTGDSGMPVAVEEGKGVETGNGVVELGEAGTEADEAEGTLMEGGVEGEGTYRLERDGGPARTVCLTSTVIDLSSFVGKKVKVWGETISPISCPWLMDVVKVKEAE